MNLLDYCFNVRIQIGQITAFTLNDSVVLPTILFVSYLKQEGQLEATSTNYYTHTYTGVLRTT